jgi:hypothetical protein
MWFRRRVFSADNWSWKVAMQRPARILIALDKDFIVYSSPMPIKPISLTRGQKNRSMESGNDAKEERHHQPFRRLRLTNCQHPVT